MEICSNRDSKDFMRLMTLSYTRMGKVYSNGLFFFRNAARTADIAA